MAHSDDLTWNALSGRAQVMGIGVRDALNAGRAHYDRWQVLRAGKTNDQLATELSTPERPVTATDVAELDASFAASFQMLEFYENRAAAAGNHYQTQLQFM